MNSEDDYEANLQNAKLIQSLGESEGKLESPIDLDLGRMKVINLNKLEWFNIDVTPKKLKITNTGRTAILSAKWQGERAYITGGPFAGKYIFSQIHFHWGENEMEGSEHSVDGSRMPMELHAVHFKSDYGELEIAIRRDDGVAVLVYLFKLQGEPNPYIDEIVKDLQFIRTAHSSVRLNPMNLTNIIAPFNEDYFLYWGSITTIQNVHKILWLISRVPIGISMEQIPEFRTLTDNRKMPLLSNCRSLKDSQNRNVFHVSPSGSTYASLLPIPRDIPQPIAHESSAINDAVSEKN